MSRAEPLQSGSPAGRAVRYDGATRRLFASEIGMVFRRRRNRALLALIAAAPITIGIAIKVSSPHGGGGPQFLNQVSTNGVFLVFTALTVTLPLLLPLLVGVVAGDSIAGEAGTGTLRYLLTLPVGRGKLLIAKAVGVVAFTAAAVCAVAVVGLIAGGSLFGLHPVTLLSGDTVSLGDGLLRTLAVTIDTILILTGYLAIGIFISTLTEVPVAAMAGTIGVAIVANVLDAVPQLGSTRRILFTHHWLGFAEILRLHVDWAQQLSWLLVQVAYIALFAAAAWARFTTMDVTS